MSIEIGDKVRFLNDVGGGIVVRKEGYIIFVEDGDGFEVPSPQNELVVVEKASEGAVSISTTGHHKKEEETVNQAVSELEAYHEEMEEDGHNDFTPKFFLAFTKGEQSNNEQASKMHVYLINDSNYYCSYLISQLGEDGLMYALHQGTIQPNTKMPVDEKTIQELDCTWDFQLILFKKGKPYPALAPISTSVHVKAKKFVKDNSFTGNDFFHQPAVLMSIIKSELEKKIDLLTERETREIIKEKEAVHKPKVFTKRASTPELLEIDLHIHELLESTTGLSNGEILQIQMDKFNSVMDANATNKGRKIVFIHGVGSGTLKTELRKQLERKYKGKNFQDASFKEYGYGATMVIM